MGCPWVYLVKRPQKNRPSRKISAEGRFLLHKCNKLFCNFLLIGTADRKLCPGIHQQSMAGPLVDMFQIDSDAVVAAAKIPPPHRRKSKSRKFWLTYMVSFGRWTADLWLVASA